MQNKYKLPDDVRRTVIGIVIGYNRRKDIIKERESEICAISGGRFETYTSISGEEVREFTPSGKGGTSSPVERQADDLAYYHETDFDYKCNKAIDEALDSLPLGHFSADAANGIRKNIIKSCVKGHNYNFNYSGIYVIGRSRFYQLRNLFLYYIAIKLKFI